MKFNSEIPSCRTLHAQITYKERLILYGGTDLNEGHAEVNELWILQPLLLQKPVWINVKISDDKFLLPDGICRHSLAIHKVNDLVFLLIIGGQRKFNESEAKKKRKSENISKGIAFSSTYTKPDFIYALDITDYLEDGAHEARTVECKIHKDKMVQSVKHIQEKLNE